MRYLTLGLTLGIMAIYSLGCAPVIHITGQVQREKDLFETDQFECIIYDCWE